MAWRAALVTVLVLGVVVVAATWGRKSEPNLPAPVTLAGIAGVEPGYETTVETMRRRWRISIPYESYSSGSTIEGNATICAGSMRGSARFFSDSLMAIWFVSGARTDKGVGIGSTLAELRRAYGARLREEWDRTYVIAQTAPPRNAIEFRFRAGAGADARVRLVGFGWNEELINTLSPDNLDAVTC